MSNVVFAFDLHNTLLSSNDAWIEAYMEHSANSFRKEVIDAVYRKQPRKKIAEKIGVSYDAVYQSYCRLVQPKQDMLRLLQVLKAHFPLYLISAASSLRVENDLKSWNGKSYFDVILTKENFHKDSAKDWERLLFQHKVDLMIYIGNDIEEDITILPGVISMICGDFLKKLDDVGLLLKRGESYDLELYEPGCAT